MSPEERAVLDAARRWALATERKRDRQAAQPPALESAEIALLQAVRSWLGDAAIVKAIDEDYAEQVVEMAVESRSAASTTSVAEAAEQLAGSAKPSGDG